MKERLPKISMRLFFILFITIELLVINAGAAVVIGLLSRFFPAILEVPTLIWLLAVSTVMGSALTTLLVKMLFDPITKLGKAMEKVANGDYTVRLGTRHAFREVRQIYSDFNQMTQELSSTEILKTEFISNVSHEFKTPINAIEGYATLLQDTGCTEVDLQNEYVAKILFNTRRLSKLVGNILLLSKVDNQGIQSKKNTYRLDEQIRQSILALEPKWTQRDTEFDVEMDRIDYYGSESLMMHVWNNLIENAIKYGPQEGLITIRLTKESEMIRFVIEDQGDGIPEESLLHIFDRLYEGVFWI